MLLTVWLLLFGTIWTRSSAVAISDEIDRKIRDGYYFPSIMNHITRGTEDQWLKQYFAKQYEITWIEEDNEALQNYKLFISKGLIGKDLIFNVYNDEMREESIALFRLLKTVNIETFHVTVAWANIHVNDGVLEYAIRLAVLYTELLKDIDLPPPFITKPNYFFNSEVFRKANYIKNSGAVYGNEVCKNSFCKIDNTIIINANYSGWNLLGNGCFEKIAYFREDIGLNSYYYGIHLLHPFWMTNDELEELNPAFAENYYYAHQQLVARYNLEIDSNNLGSYKAEDPSCEFPNFNPYLEYRNGLSFPVRYHKNKLIDIESAGYLKSVDTALDELAARGVVVMSKLNLTKNDSFDTLAKLIRANLDGVKYAKTVRSYYGACGYPIDDYNPAPSVLHHPETSLRDPIYWSLLNHAMKYFNMFNTATRNNLEEYENEHIELIQEKPFKVETHFDFYETDISNIFSGDLSSNSLRNLFTVRQKRLGFNPGSIEFIIKSLERKHVIVRMFLRSGCQNEECFLGHNNWFELDIFKFHCDQPINVIKWSPEITQKYFDDQSYNMEPLGNRNNVKLTSKQNYNIFKFPKRLTFPKGSKKGYNATLFVMVMEDEEANNMENELSKEKILHSNAHKKPLGFPFDREPINYNHEATNYKLYNVSIIHNINAFEASQNKLSGYFSPDLN